MSKKDLSQLTPEELMALAKNPIKSDKKSLLSPVKEFIISEDISAGTERVPGILIFDRYKRWCKANSIKPMSLTKFFSEFQHYFTRKRLSSQIVYLLSPNGFDLSPETIRKLNAEYRKRISKDGSTKNQKEDKKENEEKKQE